MTKRKLFKGRKQHALNNIKMAQEYDGSRFAVNQIIADLEDALHDLELAENEVDRLRELLQGLLNDYDILDGAFSDIISFAHSHGYKYKGEKTKEYGDKAAVYLEAVREE